EFRHSIKMDRVNCHYTAFTQARQRSDHYFAAWRKRYCSIQLHWRAVVFFSNPLRAQRFRQLAVRLAAGRDVDVAIPGLQYAHRQVSRCAKSEDPNPIALFNSRNSQRAEPNDARAQQRRCMKMIEAGWNRKTKIGASQSVFRVAAVDRIAG